MRLQLEVLSAKGLTLDTGKCNAVGSVNEFIPITNTHVNLSPPRRILSDIPSAYSNAG